MRGTVSGRGHDCTGGHERPPGHAPATVGHRPAAVDGPRAVLADGRRVRPPAHVRTRRIGPARALRRRSGGGGPRGPAAPASGRSFRFCRRNVQRAEPFGLAAEEADGEPAISALPPRVPRGCALCCRPDPSAVGSDEE